MRLHGVAVVHETDQFFLVMRAVFEDRLFMPQLHERFDGTLFFSVRAWRPYVGESLFDRVLSAARHEWTCCFSSSVLSAVLRVSLFGRVRTYFKDLLQERFGAILCLARHDRGI